MNRQPEPEKVQGRRAHMPESENALWAKTRRRNMAAPRRRTERSESAAERACKAQCPAAPPFSHKPPHFHLVPFSAPGVHPAAPFFAHRFCVPPGAKRRAPPGAPFLKGHHKFALWNDTIALRLKNRVAPLFGGGAPESVGGAKNGFVIRFFALQPFL